MRGAAWIAAVLFAIGAEGAAAQGWYVESRFGQLDFRLDPASELPTARSLALGLGRADLDGWFGLSAGVPLEEQDPLWGSADLGRRLATNLGRVTLGLDLAGQGFVQRYTYQIEEPGGLFSPPTISEGSEFGYGVAAQAMPRAQVRYGIASLEARAGGSYYRSGLGDAAADRTVGLGELRLGVEPALGVVLGAEGRHYAAEEGGYTFAGVTGMYARPAFRLWGAVGDWLDVDVASPSWSAGAAFTVLQRAELMVQAREDVLDPLYGSAPRRAWTVGLRVGLGAPRTIAAPIPASYVAGRATVALPASDARGTPRIAGDFNDWTPAPMTRSGDEWTYTVALEPGVYAYAFVDEDDQWYVPASVPGRRDDGMGGHVAQLIVEADG